MYLLAERVTCITHVKEWKQCYMTVTLLCMLYSIYCL